MTDTSPTTNIVYIHTHDSGRFFEPYGYPVRSPNLTVLADESVLFRNCFSTAPTCSPSRAGLLTGMSPHSCGMTGLAHRGFRLKDPKLHVSHLLKALGFQTVLAGIQHEAARATELSYDKIISSDPREMDRFHELEGSDYDRKNAALAAEYLKSTAGPFFLSFGMFSTHREFPEPEDASQGNRVLPPHCIKDSGETRQDMLAYMESAAIADECVGIIMDGIREAGLEKNTLVLFTTDHGLAFPRMKCTLYDDGIGVACMLKYPGNPLRGRILDCQVSHLDILPTIFQLIGLPHQRQFQGSSLVPLLEGRVREVRDHLFAEVSFHAAYEPLRCVRSRRYKYIRRFDAEYPFPVPSNMDDCAAKDHLIRCGYLERRLPPEELYDLDLDPAEMNNLAGESSLAPELENHRRLLDLWMHETDDPLLAGPIPLPPGAFTNRRSCVSPSTPDFEYGT